IKTSTPAPTSTISTKNPTTNPRHCPEGYFLVVEQCFRILDDTTRTWYDSKALCEANDLVMPQPRHPIELRSYIVENFGKRQEVWLGAKGDGTLFRYVRTGDPISNTDNLWWPTHPGYRVNGYCLVLLASEYHINIYPTKPFIANPCTYVSSYLTLCELIKTYTPSPTSTIPTTTPTTNPRHCPEGYFLVVEQCFRIFDNTTRTWDDSKALCEANDLVMCQPRHPIELRSYIVENFGKRQEVWLGAKGDGTLFRYVRTGDSISNTDNLWWPTHPGYRVNGYCLVLLASEYHINIYPTKPFIANPCTYVTSYFTLCELIKTSTPAPTSTVPTTTPLTIATTSSNLNWLTVGEDRFVRFGERMIWDDARALCRNHSLDLYHPKDILAVAKHLDDTVFDDYADVYWLGARGYGPNIRWLSGEVIPNGPLWYSYSSHQHYCIFLLAHSNKYIQGDVLSSYTCDRSKHGVLCG
ncbi:unnamed protein product, partial [Meganyctiphanes norvegica]